VTNIPVPSPFSPTKPHTSGSPYQQESKSQDFATNMFQMSGKQPAKQLAIYRFRTGNVNSNLHKTPTRHRLSFFRFVRGKLVRLGKAFSAPPRHLRVLRFATAGEMEKEDVLGLAGVGKIGKAPVRWGEHANLLALAAHRKMTNPGGC